MREWLSLLWRRKPAASTTTVKAIAPPVPLTRVFHPLQVDDRYLARERPNAVSEDDITQALELLRGGRAQQSGVRRTRPARFHIARQHVSGFAEQCLAIQSGSKVRLNEMYAGYLLWVGDYGREPITRSDFDFAMSDCMAAHGGIRTAKHYNGCRFRPEFLRRLGDADDRDVKRRLGMGLEELMGRRPDS